MRLNPIGIVKKSRGLDHVKIDISLFLAEFQMIPHTISQSSRYRQRLDGAAFPKYMAAPTVAEWTAPHLPSAPSFPPS